MKSGKIAVIDSRETIVEEFSSKLEALGYHVLQITGAPLDDAKLIRGMLPCSTRAIICLYGMPGDSPGSLCGAELAAAFYDLKVPALLIKPSTRVDGDLSLRRWRHKIPVLLDDAELSNATIEAGIRTCIEEFKGEFAQNRRAWRNIIRIEDVSELESEGVVGIVCCSWSPSEVIRLPLSLIRGWVPDYEPSAGDRFFALTNSGAQSTEDFYLRDFEPCPPLTEEDLNPFS